MSTERLLQEARLWGVQPGYEDKSGRWRKSPIESIEKVLAELKERSDQALGIGSHAMDLVCIQPKGRAWCWSLQLPSLVSQGSQGMGDLVDLKEFGRRARKELGTGFVLINPLGACLPFGPQEPSPYFRSSRLFRDPLYLRIPGEELEPADLIDRDRIYAWKLPKLRGLFEAFDGDPGFDEFLREQGAELMRFATFQALAETFKDSWWNWPVGLRDPSGREVGLWATEHSDEIRFHCWVQWQIDEQLLQAEESVGLIGDLPVGADPSGAEAWAWQKVMARGFSVGAPPDGFNPEGQDWGVVPFHPPALAREEYEHFRRLIRANMRHGSGLRLDHVMGLFRLFWIPSGGTPRDGVYVRYPYRDLAGIVAEESRRAGVFVVGEDLGTVEPRVREVMKQTGMLGYRVLWFEDTVESMGGSNLASVTTHDLPTIAGVLTGSDEMEQRTLGMDPADRMAALTEKLLRMSEDSDNDPVIALYAALAKSSASLVAVSVEDALGVKERPNMPGTRSERPNWSRVLPCRLEEFFDQPLVLHLAEVLRQRAMPR